MIPSNPSTSRAYQSHLRDFETATNIPLEHIQSGKADKRSLVKAGQQWVKAMLDRGLASSTIRAKVSAVNSVLGLTLSMPSMEHRRCPSDLPTAEDVRELLAALPKDTLQGKQDRTLIAALLFVPLQIEDLISITWINATLTDWPSPVMDAVASLRAALGKDAPDLGSPIFVPLTNRYLRLTGVEARHNHITTAEVSRRMRKYSERAGLSITARTLRAVGRALLSEMTIDAAAAELGLNPSARVTLNNYRHLKRFHR